jgi:hypothetical protein
MHCKRKFNALTLENLLQAFPYQADNLRMWDRFVDEQGKTSLNQEEYKIFRQDAAKKAKVKKAQLAKEKASKGKLVSQKQKKKIAAKEALAAKYHLPPLDASSLNTTANHTALCLVLREAEHKDEFAHIQKLRKSHDKAYERWMPHMNIFFPFVDVTDFKDAEARVKLSLAEQEAFTLEMDSIKAFSTSNAPQAIMYAAPNSKGIESMRDLVTRLDIALAGKPLMEK